jgi:hypothetical protein
MFIRLIQNVWGKKRNAQQNKLSLGTQETRAADDSTVLITYLLTLLA